MWVILPTGSPTWKGLRKTITMPPFEPAAKRPAVTDQGELLCEGKSSSFSTHLFPGDGLMNNTAVMVQWTLHGADHFGLPLKGQPDCRNGKFRTFQQQRPYQAWDMWPHFKGTNPRGRSNKIAVFLPRRGEHWTDSKVPAFWCSPPRLYCHFPGAVL